MYLVDVFIPPLLGNDWRPWGWWNIQRVTNDFEHGSNIHQAVQGLKRLAMNCHTIHGGTRLCHPAVMEATSLISICIAEGWIEQMNPQRLHNSHIAWFSCSGSCAFCQCACSRASRPWVRINLRKVTTRAMFFPRQSCQIKRCHSHPNKHSSWQYTMPKHPFWGAIFEPGRGIYVFQVHVHMAGSRFQVETVYACEKKSPFKASSATCRTRRASSFYRT